MDQFRPVVELGMRRLAGRKSPFQVTFSLTNRCNFRCEYCDLPLRPLDEMARDEWFAAIDEMRAGGMGRASVMGGEPLIHPDCGAVIRKLRDTGTHTAMNTNGWLVRDRIDDVRLLDLVSVTLDGPEAVHDRQRHKGSYARVIDAIELCKARGIQVVTMTVLTPASADTIDHVLDLARRIGFTAYFQLEHHASLDVRMPVAARMTDQRIADVARRLLALKDAGEPIGNSRSTIQRHIERGRYLGTCDECYAGTYYAYILSDGTIAPCLLTAAQVPSGNGRAVGFMRAFRELQKPQGAGCSCVPSHEVNQILSFDMRVLWNALELAVRRRAIRPGLHS
jgi:MoaA/NifB/PqqE/SkfB family radical SAM enzyme